MVDSVHDNIVLNKCIKDILALIKPVEDDRSKRLSTIQELENCIHSLASLSGAAVKPFGSFVSDLYSKSGDLDLSVQFGNGSNHPINKKKKQNALRDVRKALLSRGVTGYMQMQFIPHARVPVLQYVSKQFGISCDISIGNFAGRIKSKIFYWVNTVDERFGDMVLLIKEWAKAQNINDPKSGTLNSYSLCLLVLYHFQVLFLIPKYLSMCSYLFMVSLMLRLDVDIGEDGIELDNVISTYSGQIERIQNNPSWMRKSYHLFVGMPMHLVEDPVERPDNAARAVSMKGLDLIAIAFNDACHKFKSLEHIDRNELLALLCTPVVRLKLGVRVRENSYPKSPRNNVHSRIRGQMWRDRGQAPSARGFTGTRSVHENPLANTTAHETAVQYHNHVQPTTVRQTAIRNQVTNTAVHQTAPYQNHTARQVYPTWSQTAEPYQNHNQQVYATGFQTGPYQSHNQVHAYRAGLPPGGIYEIHNQQVYNAGFQTDGPHQNQQRRKGYPSNHQNNRLSATAARYEPVRGQFNNGSTWDSRSQAPGSAALRR
ncbi:Protein HESO1 [Zea mays]|uniref:Protein HESO1 n=1 Tax=Zea mays TaxID=4577 RepID=A0A1D6N7A6_MAIZE|nr:Protein HESO1 [Zea mays]